mmetsp:Transcript_97826/g.183987  ORF Transcript_97826/g.183987 Transcript_97826/m.183987 type:complete len:222 (+) Transcript_97826:701-1366(+)
MMSQLSRPRRIMSMKRRRRSRGKQMMAMWSSLWQAKLMPPMWSSPWPAKRMLQTWSSLGQAKRMLPMWRSPMPAQRMLQMLSSQGQATQMLVSLMWSSLRSVQRMLQMWSRPGQGKPRLLRRMRLRQAKRTLQVQPSLQQATTAEKLVPRMPLWSRLGQAKRTETGLLPAMTSNRMQQRLLKLQRTVCPLNWRAVGAQMLVSPLPQLKAALSIGQIQATSQ